MKKIYTVLTLILLLATTSTFAQDFAPVGAKWVYNVDHNGSVFYLEVNSVADTTIQGKSCQKIIADWNCARSGTLYVHTSQDSVFVYDQNFQTFNPLYIFDAIQGDEWTYNFSINDGGFYLDSLNFKIDTAWTQSINGETLRFQKIGGSSLWTGDTVVEKFGLMKYLFFYDNENLPIGLCHDGLASGLRCYSDPTFGSYETGIVDSCYWVNDLSSVTKINSENAVELWPNPANNELNIQLTSTIDELAIYNINGQLVKPINVTPTQNQSLTIDITDLPTGIYSLIGFSNQETIKAKFVKH
ncbi:MAG: hypothetical protein CL843_07835 [Crocinitomicaceae bacterium]|nr:hypothetical protein [Crocinitomicaceae bacterium]|tara:strand:- start:5416 stop:6315 length:900 start_codon:yes stop_codon:yes gene_type:complete